MCRPDFASFLEQELKNLDKVNSIRQETLKDYGLHLIGDKFPSMNRASQASQGKFNVKNVVQSLKDLQFCEYSLKDQRFQLFRSLDHRRPIHLAGDDVLIEKVGTQIANTQKYWDHARKGKTNGILLVDIAVKHGEELFAVVFAVKTPGLRVSKTALTQLSDAALERIYRHKIVKTLLKQLVKELQKAGFSKKKIFVILDRWYPSEELFHFLRSLKINFVVGGKKSLKVLLPDRKKYLRSLTQGRGRKIRHFVREVRLEQFMSDYRTALQFTDKHSGQVIEYKEAQLNLNIAKQVQIYAFRFENQSSWIYLICSLSIQSPRRAYQLHSARWPIETVHHDLKQVFGLKDAHMRRELHVLGHFKLVYFLYQTFLKFQRNLKKTFKIVLTARQLADHVSSRFYRVPDPLLVL